jgi:predicted TIM-barrel fold metal-dependent hydrolase
MDFAHLDIPLTDGHIHFPHPALLDDLLAVMEAAGVVRAHLVAVPDLQFVNQNAALIHAKAHHPDRFTLCGALDYTRVFADPSRASEILGAQIGTLQAIGFDGLKLIEGKPMVRKLVGLPLDGPQYAAMWAELEERGFPVVLHVADPEEFWNPDRCPGWARERDWFYGDGTYPAKEALYTEIDQVLARHPRLKLILAHLYFLSADLARAGAFLDAHPSVCFDLTPGVEMYFNFGRDLEASRDFFLGRADRLIFGTDVGASAIGQDPDAPLDRAESLGRIWVVRQFLETDAAFAAPAGVGHWMGEDGGGFHGIALPHEVLRRIYTANAERIFGSAPAPLDPEAARVELERQAASIDAMAGGGPVDSPARRVARDLGGHDRRDPRPPVA